MDMTLGREVRKMTTTKKFVPYDEMDCPVESCDSLDGGPQHGSVPGIKRHVLLKHSKAAFNRVDWPEIRTGTRAKAAAKARA